MLPTDDVRVPIDEGTINIDHAVCFVGDRIIFESGFVLMSSDVVSVLCVLVC